MGKRRAPRVEQTVPARVFGLDQQGKPFSVSVNTLDVSHSGARLAGLQQFEAPGETVGVEVNGQKGRFVVTWVGRKGSKAEGQVGVRSVDPSRNIWATTVPAEGNDGYQPPHIHNSFRNSEVLTHLEWRNDRRLYRRMSLKAGAKVLSKTQKNTGWGICTDVSRNGCYVETPNPLPMDAHFEIVLRLKGREILLPGVVRYSRPTWGMGVEFSGVSEQDKKFLSEVVEGTPLSKK